MSLLSPSLEKYQLNIPPEVNDLLRDRFLFGSVSRSRSVFWVKDKAELTFFFPFNGHFFSENLALHKCNPRLFKPFQNSNELTLYGNS